MSFCRPSQPCHSDDPQGGRISGACHWGRLCHRGRGSGVPLVSTMSSRQGSDVPLGPAMSSRQGFGRPTHLPYIPNRTLTPPHRVAGRDAVTSMQCAGLKEALPAMHPSSERHAVPDSPPDMDGTCLVCFRGGVRDDRPGGDSMTRSGIGQGLGCRFEGGPA